MKINEKNTGVKGIYTIKKATLTLPRHWELLERIEKYRKAGIDFMSIVQELNRICKIETHVFENIIPTVGRTMIANNLVDPTPDNEMVVEYIALGTGSTAVDNADTKLVTEVYRNSVASKTNSNNVAYVSGFFSASECNGTYYEAGVFSDATSTTDSGILVSRVLLNSPTGIVKSNTETLTIDWTITIS